MIVQRTELPVIYQIADTKADDYQRRYLRLMRLQILLPIASAVLAFCSKWAPSLAQVGAAASGLAVVVALVVWLVRPDRSWHRHRALAEFGKSQAWRHMMAVDPFPQGHATTVVEEAVHSVLARQAERWRETKQLAATVRAASQISDAMRRVRALPLRERISFYLEHRMEDQLKWYNHRSAHSGTARDIWYMLMLVGQMAVVPVALIYTVQALPVSVLGMLTSIPAAVISWLRARRHEDLAPSYALVEDRLKALRQEVDLVTTEQEFSVYVSRVEDLLTTEHAEWLIRRS